MAKDDLREDVAAAKGRIKLTALTGKIMGRLPEHTAPLA